jgi:hypothetical protein
MNKSNGWALAVTGIAGYILIYLLFLRGCPPTKVGPFGIEWASCTVPEKVLRSNG